MINLEMSSRYSTGRARKRVKVAHRLTPYDYALRSVLIENDTDPPGECKNIFEGEALMENVTDRAAYYATQRHVHSDQRALGVPTTGQNNAEVTDENFQEALQNLRFAGFAVTGYDHKASVYEQGFMATIGGVNTVMNTGDKALKVGEEVYVLPTKVANYRRIKGISANKWPFALVHAELDANNSLTGTGIYSNAVIAAAQMQGGNVNSVDDFNDDNAFTPEQRKAATDYLRKFAVGTCIRGGRKDQPIDIVLHANANILSVG